MTKEIEMSMYHIKIKRIFNKIAVFNLSETFDG